MILNHGMCCAEKENTDPREENDLETRERGISLGKRELESLVFELVLNCSKQAATGEKGGSRGSEFYPEGM